MSALFRTDMLSSQHNAWIPLHEPGKPYISEKRPRGQRRSTRTRVPSLAAGSSYARFSATDNCCFVMNFASCSRSESITIAVLYNDYTWNDHRPCQREARTACRKRVVTAATRHSASARQTTGLPEDRPVSPGAAGQDGSDLETGPLHW